MPQLSTSAIASGVGHDVGAEKFATRAVGAAISELAAQPADGVMALGERRETDGVVIEPVVGATTRVTFTVRTAAPVDEYDMPPVYVPAASPVVSTVTVDWPGDADDVCPTAGVTESQLPPLAEVW